MWFVIQIIDQLVKARDWFWEAWHIVKEWGWPFNLLAPPIYGLYHVFYSLVYAWLDFYYWLDNLNSIIDTIPTFSAIFAYFKTYFDYAVNAWNWVLNAWSYVTTIIEEWWAEKWQDILDWIDIAKQFLMTFIDQLNMWVANLQAAWDNFWVNIFPTLLDKLTLNSILATWFKDFEPFWEGWQDWRDKVIEFFTDPLQWIYDKLDEWFERFW